MSKVQYYAAATIDGYIAETDDNLDWLLGYEGSYEGPEAEAGPMSGGGGYDRFYEGVGALVSGSATYEWIVQNIGIPQLQKWPYEGKPYWVLTSQNDLPLPSGHDVDVRMTSGNVAELHGEMLASAGEGNLWIVGGGPVASQFAQAGLLDEVLVTVVPVVLGSGKPLFDKRLTDGPMQLTGTSVFETGMVELRYDINRATSSARA